MAFPNDKPSALALELIEEQVHIILTFRSADEAEAVYDRIASALRAGTSVTIGGDKPLMLEEVGGAE